MIIYSNPKYKYSESFNKFSWIWVLSFGAFYWAYKGIWRHVFINFFVAVSTLGFANIIYSFFTYKILHNHYRKLGWERSEKKDSSSFIFDKSIIKNKKFLITQALFLYFHYFIYINTSKSYFVLGTFSIPCLFLGIIFSISFHILFSMFFLKKLEIEFKYLITSFIIIFITFFLLLFGFNIGMISFLSEEALQFVPQKDWTDGY